MSEIHSTDCSCRIHSNNCVNNIYHHLTEAGAPLAMGYVPDQHWGDTFELCKGLQAGTIFPCLHKPFCGKGGKCR